MKTLILPAESSAYTAADGKEVVQNKLDGGRSRFRSDIMNASRPVNVQWICSPNEYDYLRAFYAYQMRHASEGFNYTLVIDEQELTMHQCFFIPETFILQSQIGWSYTCTAQLEVIPQEYDAVADEALIDAWFADYG